MLEISPIQALLAALGIIYLVPFVLWRVTRADRIVPLAVVQIVAGVAMGPAVLGQMWPAYYETLFTADTVGMLRGIATWAVCLFLFGAGIELNLGQAWRDRRHVGGTVSLALLLPLLAGSGAAIILLATSDSWLGERGSSWQFVVGIGMSCAVTALPILVLFLDQLGILHAELGQRVLRYASLDDIALWFAMALILLQWDRLGRQLLFFVAFIALAPAIRFVVAQIRAVDRWFVLLIWLIVSALGSEWAGLHYMVGAFLAGVVIDASLFDINQLKQLREAILLLLMPTFFLSTGLATNWSVSGWSVLGAATLLLVAQLAGKLGGVAVAARVYRWPSGEGWVIGWLLQTKALILLIFANILLAQEIISSSAFAALVIMAILSTIATIPMVRKPLRKVTSEVERPAPRGTQPD